MRNTITIHAVPLWPLVKNTFLISLVLLTLISLILAFFWFGFLRQFAVTLSDPALESQLQNFQRLGGVFVFFFALFNGVFGSVIVTVVAGLAGLLYNLLNSRGDGIELEISLSSGEAAAKYEAHLPKESAGFNTTLDPQSQQAKDTFPRDDDPE